MDSSRAMSEAEILRKHAMYQKSFLENIPLPNRCSSPVKYCVKTQLKKRKINKSAHGSGSATTDNKLSSSLPLPVTQRETLSARQRTRLSLDQLDNRRLKRAERIRPWLDKNKKTKDKIPNENIRLFYDRTLPVEVDRTKVTVRARKYVANSKYGNIYEIRETKPDKKKNKPPQSRTWIWEDEFLLWANGRERYMDETGPRTNKIPVYSVSSVSPNGTSTRGSLPSIKESPRPNAELYALYHSQRLHRTIRRQAAITIQRVFRGWYIRNFIKRLKRKAVLEHGRPWLRFIDDYRELVSRVRGRHGLVDAKCQIDLKQIEIFMNNKQIYERTFRNTAPDGKLHKDDLMFFFNKCDLWPTQREINRSFDTIFRGSRNTAEVIFLLDCSTSTGVVGFHNLIRFVKDLVHIMDVAADRTRVGVIPYNENVFSSFSFSEYYNKRELFEAISGIKLWHGLTRTDIALKMMRDMFKESRPGVQKIGIVITDGQSTDTDKTRRESQKVHEMGVEMFAVGIGNKADTSELLQIATTPDNVFHVLDVKSLGIIRHQIEKRFCLDDDIIRATGMKACLKLVIQSKLQRNGFIAVPSDVKDDVEYVTSETQVLQIIERFIENRKSLELGTRGRSDRLS